MKLKNMPVPLNADLVDEYAAPILEALKSAFQRSDGVSNDRQDNRIMKPAGSQRRLR